VSKQVEEEEDEEESAEAKESTPETEAEKPSPAEDKEEGEVRLDISTCRGTQIMATLERLRRSFAACTMAAGMFATARVATLESLMPHGLRRRQQNRTEAKWRREKAEAARKAASEYNPQPLALLKLKT